MKQLIKLINGLLTFAMACGICAILIIAYGVFDLI